MKRPRQALLIVHKEDSNPARVGSILSEFGFHIDRRCPNHGDPLPSSMDEHDAVVIFGGRYVYMPALWAPGGISPGTAETGYPSGIRPPRHRSLTERDC